MRSRLVAVQAVSTVTAVDYCPKLSRYILTVHLGRPLICIFCVRTYFKIDTVKRTIGSLKLVGRIPDTTGCLTN